MRPEFELVVPAYNEEKNLSFILSRAINACHLAGFTADTFQLVIVNNGSTDQTAAVLEALKASPDGVFFRVIRVEKNQGYGDGVWAGLKATSAPYVGWTHADLQCDPEDAFKALQIVKAERSKILVKGFRSGRNWKDRLVTQTFEFMARVLLGFPIRELNAQPKVFQRQLLQGLLHPPVGIAFDLYLLYSALSNGYQIKTIPVVFAPRLHGTSKWASNFLMRHKTMAQVFKDILVISVQEGRL